MRYANGPMVRREVRIAADLGRVWSLVTDSALPARFSPEPQWVEWLDGAVEPAPHARFIGVNRRPKLGEWRTISRILACEPNLLLRWEVRDSDSRFGDDPVSAEPMATWSFERRTEVDHVVLIDSARLGPGRSGLSLAIDRASEREAEIVHQRLADLALGMESTLAGIRELADGDGPGVDLGTTPRSLRPAGFPTPIRCFPGTTFQSRYPSFSAGTLDLKPG